MSDWGESVYQDYQAPCLNIMADKPCEVKRESPREIRNRAEKQRRDKMNESISRLADILPPVAVSNRKVDKTSVLRLTAHYLRSHQYVFGDTLNKLKSSKEFSAAFIKTLFNMIRGFLITTTYKGIVVVVSPNVQQYLGYSEFDLAGQNILNYVHENDRAILRDQLMPPKNILGPNGELVLPQDEKEKEKSENELSREKRSFIIRFKKLSQKRSGPFEYLTCYIEGSFRKADKACSRPKRPCQIVRRARFRGETPPSSGNDIVFIGVVRPMSETFMTESFLQSFNMEYRTRHSIDGQIIECDQRIALVTGYMPQEVSGVNAMNFMHRDDLKWVIIALREMYDEKRLYGESCYRLMAKNGQFVYMRTRGSLEVDKTSNAVTSFVCTNTLVDEEEGKQLIKSMKKKFMISAKSVEEEHADELSEIENEKTYSVEDPNHLQQIILHLVTNLPSQEQFNSHRMSNSLTNDTNYSSLSIIPPQRDRILNGILKSSYIIGNFIHRQQYAYNNEYAGGMKRSYYSQGTVANESPNKMSRSAEKSLLDIWNLDLSEFIYISDNDSKLLNNQEILEEANRNKQLYFKNMTK